MRKKRLQSRYRDLISTYCRIAGVSGRVTGLRPGRSGRSGAQGAEGRREPRVGLRERLGEDPGVEDRGHEVRVAPPPRDDVGVEVVGDPRASGPPKVHPHVQPFRVVDLPQGFRGEGNQGEQVPQFLRGQVPELRDVAPRGYQHVPVVVRVPVQEGDGVGPDAQEKPLRVGQVRLPGAEDAAPLASPAGLPDVLHPPGGEHPLHRSCFQPLTISRSSFPTLKKGIRFSGMETFSPVFGFRPSLALRTRTVKLPNPRISIFSPRCRASFMLWNTVSTMTSHSFFVRFVNDSDSFSTRSLLVMLPFPPTGYCAR